ncbi:MAG: hypothetical protein J7545_15665 [Roseofilum sp. SBFL]|uniref:hypothetical protein n=1 Tax=Roseofilum sp. SBFL TaxID=2821496 RepID=UPI001B21823A|nr:hypothetical protein [Roseofilum sp. SBFL]MBP0043385.1 hypothetical protein [Roseofilum sp. SBFL]
MAYLPLGVVKFPIYGNTVDNPAVQKFVFNNPPLDRYFVIEFLSPTGRPVTDGTTSVLWTCRGWFIEGDWIWGDALRIIPSDRNKHFIQYPGIPETLAAQATLQKVEFDKVWEGRYRRYVNEPNWYLLVNIYEPDPP